MDSPLLQVFFEEGSELLAESEQSLVELEKNPKNQEILNRIFRCVHTLKSSSAMLGFAEIEKFSHALEDLLDQLRKGTQALNRHVVDVLLASQDRLRDMLKHARAGKSLGDSD